MGFLADGAVAHGASLEALHEALDRLDFLERHRLAGLEIQQAAQRREVLRAIVDQFGEGLVGRIAAGAHRFLQAMDRLGVEHMELAVGAPLVLAAGGQHVVADRALGEGCAMAHQHFLGEHVEADAADA